MQMKTFQLMRLCHGHCQLTIPEIVENLAWSILHFLLYGICKCYSCLICSLCEVNGDLYSMSQPYGTVQRFFWNFSEVEMEASYYFQRQKFWQQRILLSEIFPKFIQFYWRSAFLLGQFPGKQTVENPT
jgi:hypothetical protein